VMIAWNKLWITNSIRVMSPINRLRVTTDRFLNEF
jgi:hypothetical protein